MDLLTPGIGLIFWQSLVFLMLVFLLAKFAWKPILDSLKIRDESSEEALQAAEQARSEMVDLQADNEKLFADARAEREVMLKEAADVANSIREDAKEEASKMSKKIVEDAKAGIEAEKTAALAEVRTLVVDLSVEMTEKVIRKSLGDAKSQKALISEFLTDRNIN